MKLLIIIFTIHILQMCKVFGQNTLVSNDLSDMQNFLLFHSRISKLESDMKLINEKLKDTESEVFELKESFKICQSENFHLNNKMEALEMDMSELRIVTLSNNTELQKKVLLYKSDMFELKKTFESDLSELQKAMISADQYLARKLKETVAMPRSEVEELKRNTERNKLGVSEVQKSLTLTQMELLQKKDETKKLNETLTVNQSEILKLKETLEMLKSTTLSRSDVIRMYNEIIDMHNSDNSELNKIIEMHFNITSPGSNLSELEKILISADQFNLVMKLNETLALHQSGIEELKRITELNELITSDLQKSMTLTQADLLQKWDEALDLYEKLYEKRFTNLQESIILNRVEMEKKLNDTLPLQHLNIVKLNDDIESLNSKTLSRSDVIRIFNETMGMHNLDISELNKIIEMHQFNITSLQLKLSELQKISILDQFDLIKKLNETLAMHQSDIEELKLTTELNKLSASVLLKSIKLTETELSQKWDETKNLYQKLYEKGSINLQESIILNQTDMEKKLNDTLALQQSDVVNFNKTLESLKSTTIDQVDAIRENQLSNNLVFNKIIQNNQFKILSLENTLELYKTEIDKKFSEALTLYESNKVDLQIYGKLNQDLSELNVSALQNSIILNKLDIDKKIEETALIHQSDNAALIKELTANSEKLSKLTQIVDFNGIGDTLWKDCATPTLRYKSGLYKIRPVEADEPFQVYCDMDTENGNWTVIQRRVDGSVDFYRNWAEYKTGFGNLFGEFFIGLDKLHWLTADAEQELIVLLEEKNNIRKFAKFSSFAIGDESTQYEMIKLGDYSGNAGNPFSRHAFSKFSTWDRDNDKWVGRNCAEVHMGAWWYSYNDCSDSNLNGKYIAANRFQRIYWFKGFKPLKFTQMMIRPKNLHI